MCRKFTLFFSQNVVGSLEIRASRKVFSIEVRSPEIDGSVKRPEILFNAISAK